MFGKREGTTNSGIHWENKDELHYLKQILETQREILKVLSDIDYRFLSYFGNEKDKKINEMYEILKEGCFQKSQMKTLTKLMKLARELPNENLEENVN